MSNPKRADLFPFLADPQAVEEETFPIPFVDSQNRKIEIMHLPLSYAYSPVKSSDKRWYKRLAKACSDLVK